MQVTELVQNRNILDAEVLERVGGRVVAVVGCEKLQQAIPLRFELGVKASKCQLGSHQAGDDDNSLPVALATRVSAARLSSTAEGDGIPASDQLSASPVFALVLRPSTPVPGTNLGETTAPSSLWMVEVCSILTARNGRAKQFGAWWESLEGGLGVRQRRASL